jgi:hypothetical protein
MRLDGGGRYEYAVVTAANLLAKADNPALARAAKPAEPELRKG